MACDRGSRSVSNLAAARNGIFGQVSRYLNTVGSWSTYRDLNSVEDIPERLGQVTGAFFGLEGLSKGGVPKVAGILGAIMAVQTLEQVTGAGVNVGTTQPVSSMPRSASKVTNRKSVRFIDPPLGPV